MLLCGQESASGAAKLVVRRPPAVTHGTSSADESFDKLRLGNRIGSSGTSDHQKRQALRVTRQTIERRYIGVDIQLVDSWPKHIIILLSKHATRVRHLQGQTRGICVPSTLAKWYCGCLCNMLQSRFSTNCWRNCGIEGGVHWLRALSAVWKERRQGYNMRTGTQDDDDELMVSLMIFANIFANDGYIRASSRMLLLQMALGATDKSYNETRSGRPTNCNVRAGAVHWTKRT